MARVGERTKLAREAITPREQLHLARHTRGAVELSRQEAAEEGRERREQRGVVGAGGVGREEPRERCGAHLAEEWRRRLGGGL